MSVAGESPAYYYFFSLSLIFLSLSKLLSLFYSLFNYLDHFPSSFLSFYLSLSLSFFLSCALEQTCSRTDSKLFLILFLCLLIIYSIKKSKIIFKFSWSYKIIAFRYYYNYHQRFWRRSLHSANENFT